jgi:hypothetical protein
MEVGTPEWDAMNARRIALIDGAVGGVLTAEESAELERLEAVASEVVNRTFPQPRFDSEKLAAIKARLEAG